MKKKKLPNPGSCDARKMGCKCSVVDNNHGKGLLVNGKEWFWVNDQCKLHMKLGLEKK